MYGENNNSQKAIEIFESILSSGINSAEYLRLYGEFCVSQKESQKALELFIRALNITHSMSQLYINIALIHANSSNCDAAVAYLKAGYIYIHHKEPIEEALKEVYSKCGKSLNIREFKKYLLI